MKKNLPIIILAALLFAHCRSTHETLGRYCEFEYDYTPTYGFFYDDTVHLSCLFFGHCEGGDRWVDTLTDLFQQQDNTHEFYDVDSSVDTVRLFYGAYGFDYVFTYTPSLCTFHWIGVKNPNGTYKFKPNACERGLVSFAVSQLDFMDPLPESVEESCAREKGCVSVIMESPQCVLQIKSKEKNIDHDFLLLTDRLPKSLFFLVDALESMMHDYSKPRYCTADEPDENEFERFRLGLMQQWQQWEAQVRDNVFVDSLSVSLQDGCSLILETHWRFDTLDDRCDTYGYTHPIIVEQNVFFMRNDTLVGKRAMDYLPTHNHRYHSEELTIQTLPIYDIGVYKGANRCFFYLYGTSFCNGMICPEYFGIYEMDGTLLYERIGSLHNECCNGYKSLHDLCVREGVEIDKPLLLRSIYSTFSHEE